MGGSLEGKFQVGIILNDDDAKLRRQAAAAVAPRFLNVNTSGVTLEVPTSGEANIALSPR